MFGVSLRLLRKLKSTSDGEVSALRLCAANLAALPHSISRPQYNRKEVKGGIVHLGLRDFHRVHSAVFVDDMLSQSRDLGLGVISVAMNETHKQTYRVLKEQDGLYATVERSDEGDRVRVIGSVIDVMYAPEESEKVVEALSRAKVVTLTLKENNYCLTDDFRALNLQDPRIQRDLQSRSPRTAVGLLALALEKRLARKETAPLVVISTDNLSRGGDLTNLMVKQFLAGRRGESRQIPSDWLAEHVQFPNSVSDRICHTENADNFQALLDLGVRDEAVLTTEPFRSWILEDVSGLPAEFRNSEIRIVKDTKMYENLKTRYNYGLRVALAVVGQQQGHALFETILADPLLRKFAEQYLAQVKFGVGETPPQVDMESYGQDILRRIATPSLNYQVQRLTEDVSRKLKMEWLPVINKLSAGERPADTVAFALASWTAVLAGRVGNLSVVDCNADILRPMAVRAVQGDSKWILNAISDHKPLGPRFVEDYTAALRSILLKGPRQAMHDLLDL